jgi:two-component system, OmpR family, response regulator RpaA
MSVSGKPTILVCDDEAAIRQVVAMKLRGAGYEVHEARNGIEGFGYADFSSLPEGAKPRVLVPLVPDLIVTDLQMPLVSGLEMAQRFRGFAATAHVPVIMLTARGYIVDENDRGKTNIRAMMAKPFSSADLLEKVKGMLLETGRLAA